MIWKDCYLESSVPVLVTVPEHSKLTGDWSLTVRTDISFHLFYWNSYPWESLTPCWSKSSPWYWNLSLQNDTSGTVWMIPPSCTVYGEYHVCGTDSQPACTAWWQRRLNPTTFFYTNICGNRENHPEKTTVLYWKLANASISLRFSPLIKLRPKPTLISLSPLWFEDSIKFRVHVYDSSTRLNSLLGDHTCFILIKEYSAQVPQANTSLIEVNTKSNTLPYVHSKFTS